MAELSTPDDGSGPNSERPAGDDAAAAAPALLPFTVDINTAGVAELRRLSGIGRALAKRIVQYRTDNGPFAAAADLLRVPGLSPAIYAGVAGQLSAGVPAPADTAPAVVEAADSVTSGGADEAPALPPKPEEKAAASAAPLEPFMIESVAPDPAAGEHPAEPRPEPLAVDGSSDTPAAAEPDHPEPPAASAVLPGATPLAPEAAVPAPSNAVAVTLSPRPVAVALPPLVHNPPPAAPVVATAAPVTPPPAAPVPTAPPPAAPPPPAIPPPAAGAPAPAAAHPLPPARPARDWTGLMSMTVLGAILGAVIALLAVAGLNQGTLLLNERPEVVALSSQLDQQKSRADGLQTEADALRARLDALEGLSNRVSDLETSLAAARTALDAVQAQTSALGQRTTTLESQLMVVRAAVDRFDGFLTGLRELVDQAAPTPTATASPAPSSTPTVAPSATPTVTARPSSTAPPTSSPAPSQTPAPTDTAAASTATPAASSTTAASSTLAASSTPAKTSTPASTATHTPTASITAAPSRTPVK